MEDPFLSQLGDNHLISKCHQVMRRDESLEGDYPIIDTKSISKQISQHRHWHFGIITHVDKVCKKKQQQDIVILPPASINQIK